MPIWQVQAAAATITTTNPPTPCPCTISIDKGPRIFRCAFFLQREILLGQIVVSSSPADQFGLAALLAPFFSLPCSCQPPPPPSSLPGVLCAATWGLGPPTELRTGTLFNLKKSRHQANLPLTTAVGRQCPHRFLLLYAHTLTLVLLWQSGTSSGEMVYGLAATTTTELNHGTQSHFPHTNKKKEEYIFLKSKKSPRTSQQQQRARGVAGKNDRHWPRAGARLWGCGECGGEREWRNDVRMCE